MASLATNTFELLKHHLQERQNRVYDAGGPSTRDRFAAIAASLLQGKQRGNKETWCPKTAQTSLNEQKASHSAQHSLFPH